MTRTCSDIFRVANRTRFDAEPKFHGVQIAVGNVLNRASHSWFHFPTGIHAYDRCVCFV